MLPKACNYHNFYAIAKLLIESYQHHSIMHIIFLYGTNNRLKIIITERKGIFFLKKKSL